MNEAGEQPVDWATALVDVINAPGDEGELKKKREQYERQMAPQEEERDPSRTTTP
jgi:hypothetical protein